MDILKAALYGVVQGITEWLPISSTGHMILLEEWVKMNVPQNFWEMFLVVIQFGSILAVVLLYWQKLWPWTKSKTQQQVQATYRLWIKVIIGVIPAAVAGLLFDDLITEYLYNYITVAVMLIIYGVLFIVVENMRSVQHPRIRNLAKLTPKTAFLIGCFQVLALIPGTSRSGATIIGSLLLGCSRSVAAEFSFFLAVPVMFGASGLKIVKYFMSGSILTGTQVWILLTGMLVAFVVSVFAIKFLMGYIRNHNFKVFGYYRIILGFIILIYNLIIL